MSKKRIRLLTLISYKFLPAKLGGHLAHLYFHNYISEYADSIVIGHKANDRNASEEKLKFSLLKIFKNNILTYSQTYYLPKILKTIKEEKIDIILCSHPYLGLLGILASHIRKKPLLTYSHNIEAERFRSLNKWWWKILFYYEKWVMKNSQLVFFVTNEDRLWAIKNYALSDDKCIVSPFGINLTEKPIKDTKYKEVLCHQLNVDLNTKLLYFAGSYNYHPNDEAVENILFEIYPRLSKYRNDFKILIIGKGLNEVLVKKINETKGAVIYLGFVENINDILYSADLMLNPMLSGGGIKTKAVEALGNNIKVVSTENGSFGLDVESCQGMVWISTDDNWSHFAENINLALNSEIEISEKFYSYYSWKNVTRRIVDELDRLISL
jgi:glycosyltransferase involved in cell wall biosynthesis